MQKITFAQINNEVVLNSYLTINQAIYSIDKNSILYRALYYWGKKYGVNLKHCWNIIKENGTYVWIKASVPLTAKKFSHEILNDTINSKTHDYATDKFLDYINHRKTLYSVDLFNIIHPASAKKSAPFNGNRAYYIQLRVHGLMQNMEHGTARPNLKHLPSSMQKRFNTMPTSKGEMLYRYALMYPLMTIPRYSILWTAIKSWYHSHHQTAAKHIIGFQSDKHYVYFGCAAINPSLHKITEASRHPLNYSGTDYYVFQGDSCGVRAKQFITWLKAQMHLSVKPQKRTLRTKQLSLI